MLFDRVKHPVLDKEPTTFLFIFFITTCNRSINPSMHEHFRVNQSVPILIWSCWGNYCSLQRIRIKILCCSLLFEDAWYLKNRKKLKAGCHASDCHLLCGERLRSVLHLHVRERLWSPTLLHHHNHQGHTPCSVLSKLYYWVKEGLNSLLENSVADPHPGSGAFLPMEPDTGFGVEKNLDPRWKSIIFLRA